MTNAAAPQPAKERDRDRDLTRNGGDRIDINFVIAKNRAVPYRRENVTLDAYVAIQRCFDEIMADRDVFPPSGIDCEVVLRQPPPVPFI